MSDSLRFSIRSRLLEEGDELVLRKFDSGILGSASISDVLEAETPLTAEPHTFWASLKGWVEHWVLGRGSAARCDPVRIPPGTRLLLSDLPFKTQSSLGLASFETVVFTRLSERRYFYRDALLLPNGTRVLLQDLPEGAHAVVLSTSSEPSTGRADERLSVA